MFGNTACTGSVIYTYLGTTSVDARRIYSNVTKLARKNGLYKAKFAAEFLTCLTPLVP